MRMRSWFPATVVLLLLAACGSATDNTPDAARGGPDAAQAAADAGVSDADLGPVCAGRSLKECRMLEGCVADLCYACSCEPEFKGCRRESEPAFHCPDLGCA
jgi:hypothetical protein